MMKNLTWKNENVSRYVLGTAQLGSAYGIANVTGKPGQKNANAIVAAAWDAGAMFFDTAKVYGDSERLLGISLKESGLTQKARVISKLDPTQSPEDCSWIETSVEESLHQLHQNQLWGLLLHRQEWLRYWDKGLGKSLKKIQASGKVKYLGVSIYSLDYLRDAMDNKDLSIIQAPCNLWEPELLTEGYFEQALQKSKLLFVRSLFLQGLLLMSPEKVSQRLPEAKAASRHWLHLCHRIEIEPYEICLRFGAALPSPGAGSD